MTETPTLMLSTPTETTTASDTLSLAFVETWDEEPFYLWNLGNGWSLVSSEGGQALQVSSDAPVTFIHNNLFDVAVQAHFLMNAGMVRLTLRQSRAGSYSALMDMNGQVALYRGGQVLGATSIAPITQGQWRLLYISAINDTVRVKVDEIEVITVQDPDPLPEGTLSFARIDVNPNLLLVDDVTLWVSDTLISSDLPLGVLLKDEDASGSFAMSTNARGDNALLYSNSVPEAGVSAQENPRNLEFFEDFSGDPLPWWQRPGQVTVSGQPVGMVQTGYLAWFGDTAAYANATLTSSPLEIQVDWELSDDPNKTYTILLPGWKYLKNYSLYPPLPPLPYNESFMIFRGIDGTSIFTTSVCRYDPKDNSTMPCSIPWSPVAGVHSVTFIHRSTAPVAIRDVREFYNLGLADLWLQTSEIVSPPSTPTPLPTFTPTPTPIPRDGLVDPRSLDFHHRAWDFGLPLPFTSWPVENISNISQRQGYGPTNFAYIAPVPPYKGTHGVHSGIDFGGSLTSISVKAICDGVIIGGRSTGLYTGYGLSLRCFADDPVDPDGDGYRNLSNIVVTYNHLDNVRKHSPDSLAIVYAGEQLGITHVYYYTSTAWECTNEDSNPNDCTLENSAVTTYAEGQSKSAGTNCADSFSATQGGINECKRVNEFRYCFRNADSVYGDCYIPKDTADGKGEGITCVDTAGENECINGGAPEHLHLEMFIARGYKSGNNKIRINPLLMYSTDILNEFVSTSFGLYFPFQGELLGLLPGNLNELSQNGDLGDTDPGMNGFFQIQTPTPLSVPEWWHDNLGPSPYLGIDRMISTITPFLTENKYPIGQRYFGPDCTNLPSTTVIDENIEGQGLVCALDSNQDDIGSYGSIVTSCSYIDQWEPLIPTNCP